MSFCSGSVLNQRWVLTAAHYAIRVPSRDGHFKIRFGIDTFSQEGPVSDIKMAICYTRYYRFPLASNDICLLKTFDEIPFSESVQPIALPLPNETIGSVSSIRVAGWDRTMEFLLDEKTTHLMAVDLPMIGLRECSDNGRDLTTDEPGSVFCAGDTELFKGICYGDSGSAAVIRRDNRTWVALGISSGGNCEGTSLFVSVPYFILWIKRKLRQYS